MSAADPLTFAPGVAITTSVALKRLAIVAGSLTFFLQLLQPVCFGTLRKLGELLQDLVNAPFAFLARLPREPF